MVIALTLYHEGDKIYFNLAHIIGWIEVNDNVTDDEGNPQQIPYTKVELDDNSYVDVSETPEEIADMIRREIAGTTKLIVDDEGKIHPLRR